MKSHRLAAIPTNHIIAELAAFPLASFESLELGVTRIEPAFAHSGLGGDSGRLWRAAERHLVASFPSFSIDETIPLRDEIWFGESNLTEMPLHRYLRRLADNHLRIVGNTAVPRLTWGYPLAPANDIQEPLARERWRWLALALPPDLLLGAMPAKLERIELVSGTLERHLRDCGFAEVHLHLGAGLDFPHLWIGLLHSIGQNRVLETDFESPGSVMEGRRLGAWLLRAAITRYLLAAFLSDPREGEIFRDYLTRIAAEVLLRELGSGMFAYIRETLTDLITGELSTEEHNGITHAQLQTLYLQLTGIAKGSQFKGYADVENADPIAPLMRSAVGDMRSAEVRFTAHALEYLEQMDRSSNRDEWFERLFWQVVRVRSLFYRHIAQRPMTPGLQWFVRSYGRLSPARKSIGTRLQIESAAVSSGYGGGLRSLEIRTSPMKDNAELRQFVADVEWAAAQLGKGPKPASTIQAENPAGSASWHPDLEMGIVFHFTKDRGGGTGAGVPNVYGRLSHADPSPGTPEQQGSNPSGYRYAKFYNDKQREANCLQWLLREFPLSLELVRGIDVCTDELGIPNWVLAPLMRGVRATGEEAAANVRQRYGHTVPGLAATVHAGEDFVHLLTGLRNIDEAIEGFELRSGDRIGHGMALGVNALEWAQRTGHILVSCEERLWDLVWEWSWYSRGGPCAMPGRPAFMERQIQSLSEQIFGTAISPYEVEMLRQDLYDPKQMCLTNFPNGWPPKPAEQSPRLERLREYLTSSQVFAKGRETLWVDTTQEGEILAALQADLRRKVGARGLTIEVNPTSNLLIGNMGDLEAHPLWRLRPPRPLIGVPPVSICIGSDDPIIFNSGLRQEYQAVWDALLLAGLSDEETHQWLGQTRAASLESRFTLAERSGMSIFDSTSSGPLSSERLRTSPY